MGHGVELAAADGHRLSAYLAEPAGTPRGGIVVIQEIFGVTSHIRSVADQYADAGFTALAPALFDRVERGVDVPYTDIAKGFRYMKTMKNAKVLLDAQAAIDDVRAAGKVGVLGFSWGGTVAYLAAARLEIDAAVVYYGGQIRRYLCYKPRCPVLFHFGRKDAHIAPETVERIKAANPQGIFHLYPAEHGFNCADRACFEPASAKLALKRSVEFLHRTLG